MKLEPLSEEEQLARRPIPPWILMDALQDSVHIEIGRLRKAETIKRKMKAPDPDCKEA